jgi:hypothetical protein
MDIHVISIVGEAATAGKEQAAAMAHVARRANLNCMARPCRWM